MPEGKGYGPQNTASIGKDIHVIGKHAYGYSGLINDAGTGAANATMFDFSSGNYYCIASLDFLTNAQGGEAIFVELTINGVTAYKGAWDDSPTKAVARPLVTFLIPPYTEVIFKWGCGSSKNATAVLTGPLYK